MIPVSVATDDAMPRIRRAAGLTYLFLAPRVRRPDEVLGPLDGMLGGA